MVRQEIFIENLNTESIGPMIYNGIEVYHVLGFDDMGRRIQKTNQVSSQIMMKYSSYALNWTWKLMLSWGKWESYQRVMAKYYDLVMIIRISFSMIFLRYTWDRLPLEWKNLMPYILRSRKVKTWEVNCR